MMTSKKSVTVKLICLICACLLLCSCQSRTGESTVTAVTETTATETTAVETETEETTVEASEEFINSVSERVYGAIREYALFFVYQSFDLDSYLAGECSLRDYILGGDTYNRIYAEYYNFEFIESYEFEELEASNYIIISDSCFTAEINYKLNITFTDPEQLNDDYQHLHAIWTFVKENDTWMLVSSERIGDEIDSLDEQKTELADDDDGIELVAIRENEYSGMLMIIKDPSRVFCGTIPEFGYFYGDTVSGIIDNYNSNGINVVAGINGGNFVDNGVGNTATAMPLGLVIANGQVVMAESGEDDDAAYHIAGFNYDNEFVMGTMTVNEALQQGIRDAIYCTETTGPFLVQDGEILWDQIPDTATYGAGKNPRTAIGQRSDGAVLLLTVNGRQPDSLGASFAELAQIMYDNGAVNAAAMDGGTSSQMIYEGEILNHPYSAFGPRLCPTAWLVLAKEND